MQAIPPEQLPEIPSTYQALEDYFAVVRDSVTPFALREETMRRIEKCTGRPLLCYVMRTHNVPSGVPAFIEDADLTGLADLCRTVKEPAADVLLVSNGGTVEAVERIVRLLRERFSDLRFIIPGNAYSAATLLCFAGNQIVMDVTGSLGPIDPQVNGVPARAILRGFEEVERRLRQEGAASLTAYIPLLSKYDLHLLEICKSAEELSKELAAEWLSRYMGVQAAAIPSIVEFFSDYDRHKSHGRSIDRETARNLGLQIIYLEHGGPAELPDLVRSLYNQYSLFFDKTDFFKLFENAHGVHWGRRMQIMTFQVPFPSGFPGLPPGPPQPSEG